MKRKLTKKKLKRKERKQKKIKTLKWLIIFYNFIFLFKIENYSIYISKSTIIQKMDEKIKNLKDNEIMIIYCKNQTQRKKIHKYFDKFYVWCVEFRDIKMLIGITSMGEINKSK